MKPESPSKLLRETGRVFMNGLLFKNPVLIGALGLFPVVAAGYNLRTAGELSLIFLCMAVPVGLVMCAVGTYIPPWMRPGAALCVSAVFYLPAAWLVNRLIPGSLNTLGVYAGLMICNSMILSRANEYAPSHIVWAVLADTLGCSCGFAVVLCAVSAVREYLQRGSVGNSNVGVYVAADRGTALPFFGFILVGFAAAGLQWLNRRRADKAAKKKGAGV